MERVRYFIVVVLQKVGYCVFFVLLKFFVGLEIKGKENIKDLKGPVIIASNHTGELDVTALVLALPFFSPLSPIYFVMSTSERFKTAPHFGWRQKIYSSGFLSLLGGISIRPGFKDYATSLSDHLELLKMGKTICIFPEGKCTNTNESNPARGGLGFLIYTSKATVVPIAINSFFKMTWMEFLLRRRKVRMVIGQPIKASDIIKAEIPAPDKDTCREASQFVLDRSREMMRKAKN